MIEQALPWEEIGFAIGFVLVFVIYLALVLRALAKKYNMPRRWRAWIPLAQWFLFIDIAGKPRWWKWYIWAPIIIILVLSQIDLDLVPLGFRIGWALFSALSFFIWQLMLTFSVAAIAKNEKYTHPLILGLVSAFGGPMAALILGLLAWGKIKDLHS